MSQELYSFFVKVTDDEALQNRLDLTKEIIDVAIIAKELGFKITGAEILRAQANRVLSLVPHELERLAAGGKVKAAANWGRAGKGYLDSAGFWVLEFVRWDHINPESEQQLINFLTEIKKNMTLHSKLLLAKNHTAVAILAKEYGYEISGVSLLRYQVEQILKLDDEKAECVACGADGNTYRA